jgi:tetratricopeptide (TPR) repeat protein
MRADSIAFALSGILFGVIVGWILGSQQAGSPVVAPAAAPAAASAPAEGRQAPPPLDEARLKTLIAAAGSQPASAEPRVQLGNLYFDAERYSDAVQWYEDALRLQPDDANVSTDLGVAYSYTNQPDRAIQQFERSLKIDPAHTKTMLNMGIVKAFGKQDLAGASDAWKQVIATAPNSPEAQAARKALEGLQQAHPSGGASGS